MEFPRHLHKPNGQYVICPDEAAYDTLKGFGWALLPAEHVEQPVEVLLYLALKGADGDVPKSAPAASSASSVAGLSVEEAKAVIAAADESALNAIEAEETAGKGRKGILALIEVRRADLIEG